MEGLDRYFGDDEGVETSTDENNEDHDYDYDDDDYHSYQIIPTLMEKKPKLYTVLTETDVRELQERQIDETSKFLSISTESACILLHRYKWIVEDAHDAWFLKPKVTRRLIGHRQIQVQSQTETTVTTTKVDDSVMTKNARKKAKKKAKKKVFCGICLEDHCVDDVTAASCGHRYCHDCWRGYFKVLVEDGPSCLSMRCPDVSCRLIIGKDLISTVAPPEIKERYFSYLMRSYVEDSSKNRRKWCPAAGCDLAVEIQDGFEDEATGEVICGCGNAFCWECHDESHLPVDCKTAREWRAKNSSEEGNAQWVLENSKACPKCHKLIEKTSGCNHITCPAPCMFEFCWMCLEKWETHEPNFYKCNDYEQQSKEGKWSSEEKMKKTAEVAPDRYLFYYERWASNEKSRRKAREDYENVEKKTLTLLTDVYGLSESEKERILMGWRRITDCRRLLKWTYVSSFYMEYKGETEEKKKFLTYLQGEAEAALEKLHSFLEKEMVEFVETTKMCKDEDKKFELNTYFLKVSNLINVTWGFFENLTRAVESGGIFVS